MKQEVIEKFNAVTAASDEDYRKARAGGFGWMWFAQRAQRKLAEGGLLPRQGAIPFEARYVQTADAVLDGMLASMRSVGSPGMRATSVLPWERADVEQWRQLAMSLSATMFDAGCVAAHTFGLEEGFDPLRENAPAAVFGDVGMFGLREKMLAFLRAVGGQEALDVVPEVGDCCCAHLLADRHIVESAFSETPALREAFFRGVCQAAYVAGATFAKMFG